MVEAWRRTGVDAEPIVGVEPTAGYSAVLRRDRDQKLGVAATAATQTTT
jgi:hypothetical protein